jgi:PHD/YefM family antitoxin component YafN of YafNO toxin-antitoxin module
MFLFLNPTINEISELCKRSGEPVYLTKNGEGDLVVMDIEAFTRRESMLRLRENLVAVEEERLSGKQSYSVDEVADMMQKAVLKLPTIKAAKAVMNAGRKDKKLSRTADALLSDVLFADLPRHYGLGDTQIPWWDILMTLQKGSSPIGQFERKISTANNG